MLNFSKVSWNLRPMDMNLLSLSMIRKIIIDVESNLGAYRFFLKGSQCANHINVFLVVERIGLGKVNCGWLGCTLSLIHTWI